MIDRNQVIAALMTGLPVYIIAERLGCTARHIRRIRNEEKYMDDFEPRRDLKWGQKSEHLEWAWYREQGASYRNIANRFCVSHEHVRKTLKELDAQHIKTLKK